MIVFLRAYETHYESIISIQLHISIHCILQTKHIIIS